MNILLQKKGFETPLSPSSVSKRYSRIEILPKNIENLVKVKIYSFSRNKTLISQLYRIPTSFESSISRGMNLLAIKPMNLMISLL